MDISDRDKAAILEAIAYTRADIEDPDDPESIEACTRLDNLAAKVILHNPSFTRWEIKNICFALDRFIRQSCAASCTDPLIVYTDLLNRLSSLIARK